jgi:hypothetical protein
LDDSNANALRGTAGSTFDAVVTQPAIVQTIDPSKMVDTGMRIDVSPQWHDDRTANVLTTLCPVASSIEVLGLLQTSASDGAYNQATIEADEVHSNFSLPQQPKTSDQEYDSSDDEIEDMDSVDDNVDQPSSGNLVHHKRDRKRSFSSPWTRRNLLRAPHCRLAPDVTCLIQSSCVEMEHEKHLRAFVVLRSPLIAPSIM